nr:glycyl radical enzyme domain-containing protein [Methanobacterium formicicum]
MKQLPKIKFISSNETNEIHLEISLFKKLCENIHIQHKTDDTFFYNIDYLTRKIYKNRGKRVLGNTTINYQNILNKGLIGIKTDIKNNIDLNVKDKSKISYLKSLNQFVETIDALRIKYLNFLKVTQTKTPHKNIEDLISIFSNVPLNPPDNFKEAIQSLLFINSIIWANGHSLVGLGRLDQILYPFLEKDLNDDKITEEEAKFLIKEFLKTLHKYYKFKSNLFFGDTGQIIVLSGINPDGTDSSNILTYMFLSALEELEIPDPKIILRVHSNTPKNLLKRSLKCLKKGLGYPLFSNDDVIIKSLIMFGYEKEDAYDYVTSACWEPLIPGKSLDQNNIDYINFLNPLNDLLKKIHDGEININSFEELMVNYKDCLYFDIRDTIERLNNINIRPSPLLSIFIDDCISKGTDISEGGAKYNNLGLLTVSLGNTIDALSNINRIVFENRTLDLSEIYPIINSNFEQNEVLILELKNKGTKFCDDEKDIIFITNDILSSFYKYLCQFKNKFKGKYKFGLSSPAFISSGSNYMASFDGRKNGDAFGVHISPLSNTTNISYTSITNFASELHYEKAFNGAVTDLMVEKNFLDKFEDQFLNLLETSFENGIMQVQINVVEPKKLIEAKKNPELYPNLIVRVWGFSAYFKDLPEEYKDLIIKRALQYESINY